jgi:putative tryptophan/tyrosine transport system substrate-binding protein
MNRRAFVTGLGAVLAAPRAAEAQQAAKISRIGYLATNRTPHFQEAFRQGLRDLGYVEGRNLVIEDRNAEGKPERLPALAAELVALKVDVIVASGTPAALTTKQATTTLPIVFTAIADAVTSRLVTSVAHPAGNVTGCLFSPRSLSASVWNTSSRPFRRSVESLPYGSQAPSANGRKRTR